MRVMSNVPGDVSAYSQEVECLADQKLRHCVQRAVTLTDCSVLGGALSTV